MQAASNFKEQVNMICEQAAGQLYPHAVSKLKLAARCMQWFDETLKTAAESLSKQKVYEPKMPNNQRTVTLS